MSYNAIQFAVSEEKSFSQSRTMAKKRRKESTVSFRALPSDVEQWQDLAEQDERTLADWMRQQLKAAAKSKSELPADSEKDDQAD